jgi:hypothetical protein
VTSPDKCRVKEINCIPPDTEYSLRADHRQKEALSIMESIILLKSPEALKKLFTVPRTDAEETHKPHHPERSRSWQRSQLKATRN